MVHSAGAGEGSKVDRTFKVWTSWGVQYISTYIHGLIELNELK